MVGKQLQTYLEEQDCFDLFQSRFSSQQDTETTLVIQHNDPLREANRAHYTLLVLLDLSAVFYIVDHGILLDRIFEFGMGG